ncbi:MAG: hypothetical protein CMF45_07530 [Legionellales bacterium]|nr:hypothetical protein [Legionellales bacterium]
MFYPMSGAVNKFVYQIFKMNWKHKLACSLVNHVEDLYNTRRNGLRILAYHSVGTPAYRDEIDLYNVSPLIFEEHIASLAQYNNIYVNSLKNTIVDENKLSIAFTFDDGYLDNLKYVAPLMEKHNYPWHIFVVTDFIKNSKKGFMTPGDLKELSKYKYVSIGSHSKSHIHLTMADDAELKKELSESKSYLEDLLGEDVCSVSYPYGSANQRVIVEAKRAGYHIGCSSYSNINLSGVDPMGLYRTPIFSYDDTKIFSQKIFGAWDWMKYFTNKP